jgi:outer membrane protein TolC
MRPSKSRKRVPARKRKLLMVALMSISAGGCASSRDWQSSFAKSEAIRQSIPAGGESVSWEEVLADTAPPTATQVQPVGFNNATLQVEPIEADADTEGEVLPVPEELPGGEFAGAPQPVEYFVGLALAQHPSIQAARQRVSAEVNRIPQVRALPDPKFNNTFWPIHDQSLQTAAGRVGNQMSLSQAIPWPEKLRTKAAIVSQEVQVAQAEVEQIEREITESVRLAYYEVWFATRAIAIIEETKDLFDDLTKVAEARFRSGGTQQDVLRARLESDRLDDQFVGLAKQKRIAQADLAALVQQPVTLLAEASDELGLSDVPTQLDELIALAEQCNPKLKGLAWEIQRDRQKHRLACLQKYPDLQEGLNWGLVSDDSNVISPVANGHDQINFNVGTTLPIWRDKINAGVREAANRTGSTTKRLSAERDALYGKLRRLLAQADAFTEQRDIYKKRIIPRTEDTLKLAIADYRGKRTDFFSLIETYRELLMFETQLARIDASLAGTVARIEREVGCPQ